MCSHFKVIFPGLTATEADHLWNLENKPWYRCQILGIQNVYFQYISKLMVYHLYRRVCIAVVSQPMRDFIKFSMSGKAQEVVEVFERKRGTQAV